MEWRGFLIAIFCLSLYHEANAKAIRNQRVTIHNECDGVPVTVSDSAGLLRPKSFKNNKGYALGNCTWVIVADEGKTIEFTFRAINIFCGKANRPGSKDFLSIHDSNGAVLVDQRCGKAKPNSAQLPDPFMSQTNEVTVSFVANVRQKKRLGFRLDYETVLPPVPGSDPCVSPGVLLEGSSGEGSSTGFREDNTGSYGNDAVCRWQISAPENQDVIVKFDSFAVEQSRDCMYDAMSVYDGVSETATKIDAYCGFERPPPLKSSDGDLFIRFKTDPVDVENGFHFTYAVATSGTPNDGSFPGCASGSDQQLSGASGELISPLIPGGSQYPSESECGYAITVDPGMQVQLTFAKFDVESGPDCAYDSVTIYDGPDETHPRLLGPACGAVKPIVPVASGNQVYVVFSTDSSQQGEGFTLSWAETVNTDPCATGGVTLKAASGTITSPSVDGGYGHDRDCRWYIKLDSKIAVTWGDFDIEQGSRCRYDWVEVFDGADENAKSLGQFCNSILPFALKSSGQNLMIQLKSDGYVHEKGFSLTYEAISPSDPDDGSHQACGGKTLELSGPSGTFDSPGYGGSATYKSNADCSWHLTVGSDSMVKLTFSNFNLEDSHECRADSVIVYPGSDTSGNAVQVLCGQRQTAVQVIVDSPNAFITFDTDDTAQGTGFQVAWEELARPTPPPPGSCGLSDTIKDKSQTQTKVATKSYSDSDVHRIVGGSEANKNSIPWQAALIRGNFQFCGASILSPYWVVTAAHCTEGTAATTLKVRVGDHNTNSAESSEQTRNVVAKYEHPQYNSRNVNNDMTLLKLDSPLDFNDNVQPICLRSEEVNSGTDCLATGWGTTSEGGSTPAILQQVYLPIVTPSSCKSSYGSNSITDQMICAGDSGIDACQGDSGGPLVCQQGTNGPWFLHGVTSWGQGCARPGFPGIWTRVTEFLDWIVQTTNGEVTYS